jgi:hypothetical protein
VYAIDVFESLLIRLYSVAEILWGKNVGVSKGLEASKKTQHLVNYVLAHLHFKILKGVVRARMYAVERQPPIAKVFFFCKK